MSEIRVIDSGFDYEETPTVNILGGNGSDPKSFANMGLIDHSSRFNSSTQITLGELNSEISFINPHKFRNSEEVIYSSDNQTPIEGLTDQESYFISVVDDYTVKLHLTKNDAISKTNFVILTSYVGTHKLSSIVKKSVVQSINIVSPGIGYQKKRTTNSIGINTSLNCVYIKNHDYNSGEIVKYTCEGESIEGLSKNSEYYVTKIDNDTFKLSEINAQENNEQNDHFYNIKQYVDFNTCGIGTHIFNYQDISVEVIGKVGISPVNGDNFNAKIQPIFRGEITSLHLSNGGVGYGSSEVINFERPQKLD